MLVFVDESGIHKQIDNSTFVLVYVTVKNYSDFSKTVLKTEKELNINHFHWSESVWEVKRKFLENILEEHFSFKVAVVRNPIDPFKEMERLLPHLLIEKDLNKIVIDGQKSKIYERKIKKILRDKGVVVKKLKTARCSSEPGIRVADALAGLFRWYFDDKESEKISGLIKKAKEKMLIIVE